MKNRDLSALSETALLYCNRTEADIILPKARLFPIQLTWSAALCILEACVTLVAPCAATRWDFRS